MWPDYYVHLRYRAEARDGYERWRYEHMRIGDVYDFAESLHKKGCGKFAIRRLNSNERWQPFAFTAKVEKLESRRNYARDSA